jgi:hypothetical protein
MKAQRTADGSNSVSRLMSIFFLGLEVLFFGYKSSSKDTHQAKLSRFLVNPLLLLITGCSLVIYDSGPVMSGLSR